MDAIGYCFHRHDALRAPGAKRHPHFARDLPVSPAYGIDDISRSQCKMRYFVLYLVFAMPCIAGDWQVKGGSRFWHVPPDQVQCLGSQRKGRNWPLLRSQRLPRPTNWGTVCSRSRERMKNTAPTGAVGCIIDGGRKVKQASPERRWP